MLWCRAPRRRFSLPLFFIARLHSQEHRLKRIPQILGQEPQDWGRKVQEQRKVRQEQRTRGFRGLLIGNCYKGTTIPRSSTDRRSCVFFVCRRTLVLARTYDEVASWRACARQHQHTWLKYPLCVGEYSSETMLPFLLEEVQVSNEGSTARALLFGFVLRGAARSVSSRRLPRRERRWP